MTKTCTKCGGTQPIDNFGRDKKGQHGRRADCKTCARARNANRKKSREWRDANACTYQGCRLGATTDGLCGPHHHLLANCRESPLALTDGEWVRGKGGVRTWVE